MSNITTEALAQQVQKLWAEIAQLRVEIARQAPPEDQSRALALVAEQSMIIQDKVYEKVLGEITAKFVPQMNNLIQWVDYNTQDGAEIATAYRRELERQENIMGSNDQLLTDGRNDDPRIITPHVRVFLAE